MQSHVFGNAFSRKMMMGKKVRRMMANSAIIFFTSKFLMLPILCDMMKFSNFQKWRKLRVEPDYAKISTFFGMEIVDCLWSGLKLPNWYSERKMTLKSVKLCFVGKIENPCYIRKFWKWPKISFSQNSFSWTRIGSKMLCFESESPLVPFLKRITFSGWPLWMANFEPHQTSRPYRCSAKENETIDCSRWWPCWLNTFILEHDLF